MRERLAVVLFNLGGPDRPEAVAPFLRNLFKDPAILRVPFFVRPFLARLIARRRTRPALENYAIIGGRSPLLELTEAQGRALETALSGEFEARCFVAMRYWHPFAAETVGAVKAFRPDRVLLLPLYPQFSTTTTGSSLDDWRDAASRAGLVAPVTTLCCWFDDPGYAQATASMLRRALADARAAQPPDGRAPRAVLRPWPAGEHRARRRSLSGACRGERRRGACGTRGTRARQRHLLPVARHARALARPVHRCGGGARGRRMAWRCWWCRSPSCRSIRRRWWSSTWNIATSRNAPACPAYFRAPAQNSDPGFIAALADLARAALAARARPLQPCRRAALPGRANRLPAPDRRMNDISLVIFDCDGVLIDSERIANEVTAETLTALGWAMDGAEAERRFIGMTIADMRPVIEQRVGALPPHFEQDLALRLADRLARDVAMIPGARDVLEAVRALGIPWRIASNSGHAELAAKFARTGLAPVSSPGACTAPTT